VHDGANDKNNFHKVKINNNSIHAPLITPINPANKSELKRFVSFVGRLITSVWMKDALFHVGLFASFT
jgi:hypothetical protein